MQDIMNLDDQQSRLKLLIAKGKEQGYLTYAEVNDHLPEGIVDTEQIEDIVSMINDMGITVHEVAPDADDLLMMETEVNTDEDAAEEAAAALATLDAEFGRTTDPVRMYMREMGTVDLLTREGEIRIARRIEEGLKEVIAALARYPRVVELVLELLGAVVDGRSRLNDVVVGFGDRDAPPVPAPRSPAADKDNGDKQADLHHGRGRGGGYGADRRGSRYPAPVASQDLRPVRRRPGPPRRESQAHREPA